MKGNEPYQKGQGRGSLGPGIQKGERRAKKGSSYEKRTILQTAPREGVKAKTRKNIGSRHKAEKDGKEDGASIISAAGKAMFAERKIQPDRRERGKDGEGREIKGTHGSKSGQEENT